jgi:signal transduction histidine kinase
MGAGPKRSGVAVLATSERYRDALASADLVLRGSSEGVTVQDRSGRLLYVNDAAARMSGFEDARAMLSTPPDEIVARFELLDEHGAPLAPEALPGRRVLAGDSPEPLLIHVRDRRTGEARWSLVRAHAITSDDGVPELAVTTWHDASKEQRQHELARHLAEATARLTSSLDYAETLKAVARALVPGVADWCGVDLVDEKGELQPLAVAHADPVKEKLAHDLRARYPSDPASSGVAAAVRSGAAELVADVSPDLLRARARDEEHFRALEQLGLGSVMFVPIPVRGRAAGALTLAVSHERRRFDQDDVALACEVGRRAGTAIEKARAYAAVQDAVRSRDEFLAVAGHELRTPLAALMLLLETLKLSTAGGRVAKDPERVAARVDKTFAHAQRLARLVDGMLDVSRLADGRIELKPEPLDLAVLVGETCERFADDAARAGCTLDIHVATECTGEWDASRLEQVVSNLVTNALKYAPGTRVDIHLACDGDRATITFEDRGIGIAADDRERIFDRFGRAVSERNYPGLGLGLWISRELVAAHGGTLDVESEPGRGSTFTVSLPRAARR